MSTKIKSETKDAPASELKRIVMPPKSFPSLLKSFGFKRLKQHHKGILPWQKDEYYVEVYKDNTGLNRDDYAWAIGGDLKTSTGYPGGHAYFSPEELFKEFKEKVLKEAV